MTSLYIHPCLDGKQAEVLEGNEVKRLVRELFHVYGLRAYTQTRQSMAREADNPKNIAFMVCDSGNIPSARVYYDEDDKVFCYHSVYFNKERGSDSIDRQTLRSNKISTLMRNIKKHDAFLNSQSIYIQRFGNEIAHMGRVIKDRVASDAHKQAGVLNGEEWHKLLLHIAGGNSINNLAQDDREKYLQILDKWNTVDHYRSMRNEEFKRFFSSCYLVGADMHGQYIVADAWVEGNDNLNHLGFNRVTNLEEYPDLLSVLTMLKVHCQETQFLSEWRGYLPLTNHFFENLDVIIGGSTNHSTRDNFAFTWAVVPKLQ